MVPPPLVATPPPLHSPLEGRGDPLAPKVHCPKGAKQSVSSGYNGVAVEKPGLGPHAWPTWRLEGQDHQLVTVPPGSWVDHHSF